MAKSGVCLAGLLPDFAPLNPGYDASPSHTTYHVAAPTAFRPPIDELSRIGKIVTAACSLRSAARVHCLVDVRMSQHAVPSPLCCKPQNRGCHVGAGIRCGSASDIGCGNGERGRNADESATRRCIRLDRFLHRRARRCRMDSTRARSAIRCPQL
jgi:hypothetical protein